MEWEVSRFRSGIWTVDWGTMMKVAIVQCCPDWITCCWLSNTISVVSQFHSSQLGSALGQFSVTVTTHDITHVTCDMQFKHWTHSAPILHYVILVPQHHQCCPNCSQDCKGSSAQSFRNIINYSNLEGSSFKLEEDTSSSKLSSTDGTSSMGMDLDTEELASGTEEELDGKYLSLLKSELNWHDSS